MQVLSAPFGALLASFDFFFSALKRIESNLALLLKYKIQDVTPFAVNSSLIALLVLITFPVFSEAAPNGYWAASSDSSPHFETPDAAAAWGVAFGNQTGFKDYPTTDYYLQFQSPTYYEIWGTHVGWNGVYGTVDQVKYWTGACPDGYLKISGDTCSPVNQKNLGSCPASPNPISYSTLNKSLIEVDYRGQYLQFHRAYNSQLIIHKIGGLGAYWWSFNQAGVTKNADGTIFITRENGASYLFTQNGANWVTDADITDTLVNVTDSSGAPAGWKYTTSSGDVELYDIGGNIRSITPRNGLTQTFIYSDGTAGPNGGYILDSNGNPTTEILGTGLLIRVTDPAGRSLNFGYDQYARIVKMVDPEFQTYLYGYDNRYTNNLSSVTYPDGKTKTYLYGEAAYTSGTSLPHALTGILDENGTRYATYRYDSTGRAYDEDHGGSVDHYNLAYTTDTSGNPVSTTVTDPLGTARTYNFQTILGVVKSTGTNQPGGSGCGAASSGITYDANGNVASRTDFNGNVTTYTYDMARNLETSRTEASGTPLARTITTTWHPTFRLPTQITEPGRVTNFSYDAATGNLLTKSITDSASGKTRTWTYTYTTAADTTLPALLKSVDGPRTDVADVTSYAYYPNGDLKNVTNALGQVTGITGYDANGRALTIADPNGLVTTLAYTPRGWLASRSVGAETTAYAYDGVGQLTRVTLPDSSGITYTYDAAHRLTDITDALGNRIHYTLDNIGNRVQESVYDNLNNLTQTKSRAFDALNRLWKEIGAYNQTTLYTYDPNGNLTSITDPLAHTTVNSYDALNRLTQASDAAGSITRYVYNSLDQLRFVRDPRDLVTYYTVNALGDQTQLNSPDTGVTGNTYDAAGNLATRTDARGIVTNYAYDALNRVTQISYSAASFPPIVFQYDSGPNALGRLSQMSDETGTTTWTYNAQGRVASKTQLVNGVSQSLSYGYDTAGRLTSLTYPSGKVVSYGYDAQGRVNSLSVNGTPLLSSITYQAFGQAKAWTWGNGSAYMRSFDQDGRMTSYPLGSNLRALAFDAASRIGGITDTIPAANQTLGYDNLDRLTSWVAPSTNQSYAYDANGNRQSLTIGATAYAYSVNPNSNRLQTVAGPTPKTYSYDAAGHITGNGTRNYLYDPAGFMYASLPATWPSPDVVFKRNGLGQRLIKTAAGVSTLYVYDGNAHLLGEYDGTGAALQETIYLGDQPVGVMSGGALYYVYADHLNTPRLITNTANTPVWQWDSDPFGNNPPDQNPSGLGTFVYNGRFPGQYADKETGLNYNMAREYSPEIGGYIQSDPLGLFGGSLSTYAYVNGNPVSRIDPFGLDWVYSQSTGQVTYVDPSGNTTNVGTGYAGQNAGLNNPANQSVPGTGANSNGGPLPQGTYTIEGQQNNVTGAGTRLPASMRLTPDPANDMYDRGGFLIHGDNRRGNQSASEGCVILNRNIRNQIGNSGDPVLRVVP